MGTPDIRKDYERGELDEDATRADPFAQFGAWLQEAIESGVPEPTAMTLARSPSKTTTSTLPYTDVPPTLSRREKGNRRCKPKAIGAPRRAQDSEFLGA